MVSEPKEWPAFEVYLEDIKVLMGSFRNTKIIHVPRTENSRADSLARSARKLLSFVVHMDAVLPAWFAESI
ncbi:BnaUnng04430D [Brassica napus]|uniref:BnaUnng04430D protein n=1 Tax=Brassica napus TaxID=3708 RepID=A0A078JYM2_BRANA|nr:BnaUnng04430D [Brassica napus]